MSTSAAEPSFESLFKGRGGQVAIDFHAPAAFILPVLSVPKDDDCVDVVVFKMEALAEAITEFPSHSLAVRTDFIAAKHSSQDPVAIARMSMKPYEIEQYDAWTKGITLPLFDWAANRAPVPAGKGSARRYERHAAAMDIMWDHEGATAENAAWLFQNWDYVIPLVKAVGRVTNARRDLVSGRTDLTQLEMAEIQTVRKIVAVSNRVMKKYEAEMRKLFAQITSAIDLIQARERSLEAKRKGAEPESDPVNRKRKFSVYLEAKNESE